MIKDYSPIVQALLGTLFTWALTAAGAALVIVIRGKQRKLLDISLGFAGGVMIAASYWSLLAPAIEMATKSKIYGVEGEYAFVPIGVGFLIGAAFVYGTDALISSLGIQSPNVLLAMQSVGTKQRRKILAKLKSDEDLDDYDPYNDVQISGGKMYTQIESTTIDGFYEQNTRKRQTANVNRPAEQEEISTIYEDPNNECKNNQWRRVLLLVVAITVHNIPEGLAVGVGFAAVGNSVSATFENARLMNLAIGIGIQNFPEGLAVSLPLQAAGISTLKSFWYGQLSGMVEPLAGVLGAIGVTFAEPALPYALSFAAGAMIYVVIDDIVPEAHQRFGEKTESGIKGKAFRSIDRVKSSSTARVSTHLVVKGNDEKQQQQQQQHAQQKGSASITLIRTGYTRMNGSYFKMTDYVYKINSQVTSSSEHIFENAKTVIKLVALIQESTCREVSSRT
ncbi:Zinc transporter ZIP11 [Melipona quadrifasciata]|uniref:Zinc transporter ZIP11 n=1 Tax=Melipona quadrifasciata TaxID=166423 RepID=A0A0N0BJN8_9HYME|nr:Zinc transporter ZIP11 [Melipona quadrifasciata]